MNGRAENEQEIQDLGALQQEREYTIWDPTHTGFDLSIFPVPSPRNLNFKGGNILQVKLDSLLFWARFLEPQGVPPRKSLFLRVTKCGLSFCAFNITRDKKNFVQISTILVLLKKL